ncbi:two-component sensor histidine kinase [Kitasatospora xanthocidica]|uniref:sensor histidine kinase n=1 Tax=Kitasatospora xanthocidica TaxID=83382 RepID=UPI0016770901|nr:sensor histidine kinase [Kitasatospora xanthocidica]GHF78432.1 two-component sensor histidine kinase [Kitasatospora xanthocidica]
MESLQPPLLKRLSTTHWAVIDCAAAVLVMAGSTLLWQGTAHADGPKLADLLIAVLSLLAVAFRRRWPLAALAGVVTVGTVATFVRGGPVPLVAVAFAMYVIPQRSRRREALRVLAATLLVMVPTAGLTGFLQLPYGPPTRHSAALLVESALLVTVAWTIGYAVQQQRLYTDSLHAQAEQRAQEQLAEARRAAGEERLRIARELHDVVAHTMSVIAVQAGVANHVAAERPDEARRALSSIEETSRGALREMRAMLGILRGEENSGQPSQGGAGTAPAPGLADLGALVERTAEAGVRVDLEVCGERPELSAGLELAAFRVVQEAVTNVIKHAAVERCRVAVMYHPDAVTVEITDDGVGDGWDAGKGIGWPVASHGIVGMRERVGMYGGAFRAGPRPGGGFQVTARFPATTTGVSL